MHSNLISLLETPPLYRKTEVPFWDDAYISQQMLKAHLDPDFEGASRKLDFIDRSADWIQKIVPPAAYRELLDLGCGPGLYAERFAKAGYKVTGVDFSRRSIGYAADSAIKAALDIRYRYQNYLDMRLGKEFDFSTMIYCDYGALSTADRKTVLDTVFRHLRPGGKFLFDVFSLAEYNRFQEKCQWELCPGGGFWCEGKYAAFQKNLRYSDRVTLEQTTVVPQSGPANSYYIWKTYFTAETLTEETTAAGFKVCGIFGDIAGKAYHDGSPTIAILLEK